jgi:hypothetical protein
MIRRYLLAIMLISVSWFWLSGQPGVRSESLKRADCFFGIHFDLHASEDITDAGRTLTFEMIDTFLTRVRPDFIQIDCKGHPGISSYPTEVGFHLKGFEKDPLRLFREVTEKNKVALFMHFSGVWDNKVVQQHPEWAVIKANGERSTQKVSFFSPYIDTYMIPQLKELSGKYKVDGAWIDGECWAVEPDYGEASLKRFTQQTGITEIPRQRNEKYFPEFIEYTRELFREHLKKYIEAIHDFNPGFQITSNWSYSSLMPEKVDINVDYLSGDVTPQNGVYRSAFEARCLAPQGKPWDLMAWGFSWNGGNMPMSIKSPVQLKQEAAQIISMGGGVQFYFQQNRDLSLKPWIAYMLEDIGNFCRERQKFCHKSVPVPQIALLYPSRAYQKNSPVPYSRPLPMLQGTLYAILDGQNAIEILMEHNLSGRMDRYPLIVIPECDYLDPSFIDEIRRYVANGGNLLVIGTDAPILFKNELGIITSEKVPAGQAFISAGGRIGSVRSEILKVELTGNSIQKTRFYQGSDYNYPSEITASSVSRIGKGMIAAVYFNAGSSYIDYKTPVVRDFIDELIEELFPARVVRVTGSHLVHIAVNRTGGKTMVNLINVAGEHTNQNAIGYDEVPPLKDIYVSIKTDKKPSRVILQPEGKELKLSYDNGRFQVLVPELKIHSIIELQ